ncbi:hypothetical protein Hanom_Chr06g00571871 [Helianthus anomalus]
MAIKLKPQGPRCKKFEFWNKVAKLTKPQGPKWQFTLLRVLLKSEPFAFGVILKFTIG